MKNLKNIIATLVLVSVMGVSTSFAGGIYIMDRATPKSDAPAPCEVKDGGEVINGGIMVGLTGIMVGLTGIMVGVAMDAPSCTGGTMTNDGIMVG
jgi:virulence family protein